MKPSPPEHAEPERIECYYDDERAVYWVRDARADYMRINESAVRRALRGRGFSNVSLHGSLSEVDLELELIQQNFHVSYAGPLAGYSKGAHEQGGLRILVTSSPKIVQPKKGSWPTLHDVVHGLLGEQADLFHCWAKIGYECTLRGRHQPGQALAIAGPRNCGKTLLQDIITELLGGRDARPYAYMSKATNFNSDWFAAEHLRIGDEASSTDIRARRSFGNELKKICAETRQFCHKKNREGLVLRPLWRLSITINDEDENLMVMPPFDEGLEDKIILLKATRFTMPMPASSPDQKAAFWSKLIDELPAYCQWLCDVDIPEEMSDTRYGVAAWQHPELLQALSTHAPESKLLAILDHAMGKDGFTGTAEQLEEYLGVVAPDATRKLFTWSTACGVYLSRLAAKHPDRVQHKGRKWTIIPSDPND